MKHIIRFLRLIKAGLVILCILIISSAVFPGVFSWSTEEGKAHIQEFVDNIKDSADKVIADISEKTGWFENGKQENPASSDRTGRADYKAPEDIGKEIYENEKNDKEKYLNSIIGRIKYCLEINPNNELINYLKILNEY